MPTKAKTTKRLVKKHAARKTVSTRRYVEPRAGTIRSKLLAFYTRHKNPAAAVKAALKAGYNKNTVTSQIYHMAQHVKVAGKK